ncbi:MAG: transporter family protein [Polaromonas sp.]|nr:transporter family protein [Polaromonas sp.]
MATAAPATFLLQLRDIGFAYEGPSPVPVLRGLSAAIPAGVTLVRGGDGRGKTTLMRLLAGELRAPAGRLVFQGTPPGAQPADDGHLFWMDPRSEAMDALAVGDYLALQRARYPAFDDALLDALVQGLDLGTHLGKHLYMLSTGSKRKVWMAAALASRAPVTLLDMPFAAVDKASMGCLLTHFQQAAHWPARALVIADYEAPPGVPLAAVIDLGD